MEPDRKIINFSRVDISDGRSRCEVCGAAKQTESVCGVCAVRLIDIALSSIAEDGLGDIGEPGHQTNPVSGAIGRCYDHYEICYSPEGVPMELGRGSMGITYKATDRHLGCSVALKIINTRHLTGSAARTRLLREARTIARLRHPNIASVFHLGLDDANCYFAMEYIEGETLERRIRRAGPLSPEAALRIVIQAARALRVAHEQHFIHRDIKPTNIMLVDSGHHSETETTVKVIDFGLVKAADETTEDAFCEDYFAGTPHYASPEQLVFGTVDERSDIYALGMCLWYMLCGELPDRARFPDGVSPQIRGGPFQKAGIPPATPTSAVVLLESMLNTDPALRPQSAVELLRRAQECITEIQLADRVDDWSSRRRALGSRLGLFSVTILGTAVITTGVLKWTLKDRHTATRTADSSSANLEARVFCSQADECLAKFTPADNLRAIDLYEKAIAISPNSAAAHTGLAAAYFHNVSKFGAPADQLELATTYAQRAIALDGNAPKAFTILGAIQSFQGRHWEALAQIHHALELNPKDPQAMRTFGTLWSNVGKPYLGLPWAVAATRIEPSRTTNWTAAADASVDLCADENAERYYRNCLEIDPATMSAHCGLLHIHLLQGNYQQALEDFNVEEALHPGLILPLTLRAQIALFSGDYAEAETVYRRLSAINRNGLVNFYGSISYLSALGFLRCQAGDAQSGTALLEEAAALHQVNFEGPEAIYDLAAIRAVQGHKADALLLLRQAITSGWTDFRSTLLDPRFESLRNDPTFGGLLGNVREHVAQMRKISERLCAADLRLADYPVRPQ